MIETRIHFICDGRDCAREVWIPQPAIRIAGQPSPRPPYWTLLDDEPAMVPRVLCPECAFEEWSR